MKNIIHPTALIDSKVKMGSGNYIGPYCVIGPNVELGSNNRLESHVCIGSSAEHREYFLKDPGFVKMGDNNVIREFVTINAGTSGSTLLGNNTSLLKGSHVGHDAVIRDQVNLGVHAIIGGHAIIGFAANLGLATVVHQYRVVGACAMIGMNSTVTKDVLPFVIAFGAPCVPHRINRVGLERCGIRVDELALFESWFTQIQMEGIDGKWNVELLHHYQQYLLDYENDKTVWDKKSISQKNWNRIAS